MAAQQDIGRRQSSAEMFTLDDVREVLREREQKVQLLAEQGVVGDEARDRVKVDSKRQGRPKQQKKIEPSGPRKRSAASIVDILGFDPGGSASESVPYDRSAVRPEWLENYDVLVSMRDELQARIAAHRAETLCSDDGDQSERLRILGQNTADGAADHADLERALTFVENERELLDEVVGALGRIFSGTYGVCAQTGKPIDRKRLAAIPFAKFSLEGQREIEEMRRRSAPQRSDQGALFVAGDSDGDSLMGGEDGDD